jgi:hypothetical protein
MFCPSCGHEQINEENRYCSRCGFSFEVILQVLTTGGILHELEVPLDKQSARFSRSNSWKYSLSWFLLFVFLLAPLLAIAGVDALPELAALFGFFGALLILLFPFIFLKSASHSENAQQLDRVRKASEYGPIHGKPIQHALPPQKSVPVSAYNPPMNSWKALDTSDLISAGSVTEGTTKLLEKDETN